VTRREWVSFVLCVVLLEVIGGAAGAAYGCGLASASGQVWAGVLVGVLTFALYTYLYVVRQLAILPWRGYTVTVWMVDGSRRHYRMATREGALALQAKAVALGQAHIDLPIEARITRGRVKL
jgi:hypothetical protein